MNDPKLDPGHNETRNVFRVLGPVVALVGLVLIIVGFGSALASMGSMRSVGPPRFFWCFFVGGPIFIVGMALCKFGYMGKVTRYVAGEMAPVAKDTFNYMADGTADGVRTVAQAIGQGLAGAGGAVGSAKTAVRCHKCNNLADADARFCDDCGAALTKSKACSKCNEMNDPDAKFCDNCGGGLP